MVYPHKIPNDKLYDRTKATHFDTISSAVAGEYSGTFFADQLAYPRIASCQHTSAQA
ncbi:hypothetical protein F442_06917 [Phytophthora nicotianae P10297]|uniref:Uncharacterized protein n=1 Tax=Phytophthora nicotianae P10297 TaxID=1317064 RepID=W2ZHS2_PHYNI|nr:hypothetical protein F442_06917 [Phytophthora nicotianae P10297]